MGSIPIGGTAGSRDELLLSVRDLDMDDVRAEIAAHEAEEDRD